jgi:hypothetical protein
MIFLPKIVFIQVIFHVLTELQSVLQTKDLTASSNLVATKLVLYLIGLHLSVKTFRHLLYYGMCQLDNFYVNIVVTWEQ